MKINLKIITPTGIFFNAMIDVVTVKTTEGYLGILPNHIPLVANLVVAPMFIRQNERVHKLAITAGILYVTRTEIKILTDHIEAEDKKWHPPVKDKHHQEQKTAR